MCNFLDPVGLFNGISCETGIFSSLNPHRFFQSEILRLYLPTLEHLVECSVLLPRCSSWFICTQMWDHLLHQLLPAPVLQLPPCRESSPPWLPISSPPTFLFNSLVVGLPYSIILWQFWLFFAFKFVVVLLLVVQGGKVYLPMPPSWLEVPLTFLINKFCCEKYYT